MASSILDKILKRDVPKSASYLRQVISGSFYKITDIKGNSDLSEIKTLIDTMRALAKDSQISTALSYYATDATVPNSSGDILWATPKDKAPQEIADAANALFRMWKINSYARDQILEIATVGNLYMPTTDLYKMDATGFQNQGIALDHNTIKDASYAPIPAYKLPPENILHLYMQGEPRGYIQHPDDSDFSSSNKYILYPEESIIHFSLGGLLGEYSIDFSNKDDPNIIDRYDIKFASPLLEQAVQPTQILNLLEDASVLTSLIKTVRFVNVDCGNAEEEEIQDILQQIKDKIEQQLSLNTATGDTQSFLNPQSPNNLIYLPKVNGNDAISITDLNMKDDGDAVDKLLEYYQNKKLSVIGTPKEALNYSSAEGLGGAGAVMSQRSQLYSNTLQRIEMAFMNGWREALNQYFISRGRSGWVDQYDLHMQPIITQLETVQSEKRDSAVGQASSLIDMLKSVGITDTKSYKIALVEALNSAFPQTANIIASSNIDVTSSSDEGLV